MAHGVLIVFNFWLSMYVFTKPADFEFSREKVLRLAKQQMHGVISLEGQLSSIRTRDLFMHLFTHVFTYVLSSQQCKQLTRMCHAGLPWMNSHSVAAIRLVCTSVIFNNSETSGPLLNGRIQNVHFRGVYKIFWRSKGGSSEPPRTPSAYGPEEGGTSLNKTFRKYNLVFKGLM